MSHASRGGRSRGGAVAGFSVLELMIAVLVVALLAAIAFPSYKNWVDAGRRADGTAALMDLANRMQRFYAENNRFDTASVTTNLGYAVDADGHVYSPQRYYWLTISAQATNTYTLLATRAGVQANDTRCGDLTLTSASVRDLSGQQSGITASQCW